MFEMPGGDSFFLHAETVAGGVAGASRDLPVAGSPSLAGEADEVTGGFEEVGVAGVLGGEFTGVGAGMLNLPAVASGQERRA